MPRTDLIQVLVADDETPARQRLCSRLAAQGRRGGPDCGGRGWYWWLVDAILTQKFDLVLLDVQMPQLDGLGVIDAVGAREMPLTNSVTAYDQHGRFAHLKPMRWITVKPFSDERFEVAMSRVVKTRLDERSLREFSQRIITGMVSAAPTAERRWDRLVIKSAGTTQFLRVADIDWIEAAGVYVCIIRTRFIGIHLFRHTTAGHINCIFCCNGF